MNSSDDKPASARELRNRVRDNSADNAATNGANYSPNYPPPDPLPDPEPSVPSLSDPDPGVFHHDPATQRPASPNPHDPDSKS
jgi:hypothetical protein